ncbi:MAG: AAA family ATPase [Patescibacteria group bacterium]
MYLEQLHIQGFKSFAQASRLDFLGPQQKTKGITTIVGPNGSGKSNVADAIRWVLGEQSMKLLRGKKSEDVIFAGSDKKSRSGFAEVTMRLLNEGRSAELDYPEVEITRRLYRDGESEYLLNKNKVRLTDIQMILAKANFGERHYAVIGQGMIESLLALSAEERREFFDEASGVRPLQIKKQQSIQKLALTEENLMQATTLLAEIEPRLRSLARQVKRLEERSSIEEELHGLQHLWYGGQWRALGASLEEVRGRLTKQEALLTTKAAEVEILRSGFQDMEKEETATGAALKIQRELSALFAEQSALRDAQLKLDTSIARSRAEATVTTPLPLSKIISELQGIVDGQAALIEKLLKVTDLAALASIQKDLAATSGRTRELLDKLERPPKTEKPDAVDPKTLAALAAVQKDVADVAGRVAVAQKKLTDAGAEESSKKGAIFAKQRELAAKQQELHVLESAANQIRVDMARLETRREALEQEMTVELKERAERVRAEATAMPEGPMDGELAARIQKLKYSLELIGGIDPEVVKEYQETNERFTFLSTQCEDLRLSIENLEKAIIELEGLVEERFATAFDAINTNFDRYFKILFNGGQAKLSKTMQKDEDVDEESDGLAEEIEEAPKTIAEKFREQKYAIDITANPPGKKVKNLAMLSGGERALTAIALICAIISTNPPPFVVLDEVDAALDESNSIRFAAIVDELSHRSQFVVITHNRYTMEKSSVLYGVSMGEDGASRLLSVKMEDVLKGSGAKQPV